MLESSEHSLTIRWQPGLHELFRRSTSLPGKLEVDEARYLNFNEIDTYVESANSASIPAVNIVNPN